MNFETRQCQNCKNKFAVEAEDFQFYDKIKVPPPTFCPGCRMQRRMSWRNERRLYKRKCDLTGKDIISIIAPDKPYKVYDRDVWWSDQWDPMQCNRPYDFSKPFFQQYDELLKTVPLVSLFNKNAVNSDYANHSLDSKDCYLLFASIYNENVLYANGSIRGKDSMDTLECADQELCYGNIACVKCFKVFFSHKSTDCHESFFLYNCKNCNHCFGCVNQRNASYCLFNEQLSKEEYELRVSEYAGSFEKFQETETRFHDLKLRMPHRFATLLQCVNVIGDNVTSTKNCYYCFDMFENVENSKYVAHGGIGMKDSYDGYGLGIGELLYDGVDFGLNASRLLFCAVVYESSNLHYCYSCYNSSDLFGCYGLRQKQYCILNKQYTKEEYEELLPKIKKHMTEMPYRDTKGRTYSYGEFFPAELSPFAYNETIANDFYPISKEDAIAAGYPWRDTDKKAYETTVNAVDLPDHIKNAPPAITKEIIKCSDCGKGYRVIDRELVFLRSEQLPLPRKCPDCRHKERFLQRNPMHLWHRTCQCAGVQSEDKVYKNTSEHFHKGTHCPNEFETSYAPDRKEIVYCEQCYQSEVV